MSADAAFYEFGINDSPAPNQEKGLLSTLAGSQSEKSRKSGKSLQSGNAGQPMSTQKSTQYVSSECSSSTYSDDFQSTVIQSEATSLYQNDKSMDKDKVIKGKSGEGNRVVLHMHDLGPNSDDESQDNGTDDNPPSSRQRKKKRTKPRRSTKYYSGLTATETDLEGKYAELRELLSDQYLLQQDLIRRQFVTEAKYAIMRKYGPRKGQLVHPPPSPAPSVRRRPARPPIRHAGVGGPDVHIVNGDELGDDCILIDATQDNSHENTKHVSFTPVRRQREPRPNSFRGNINEGGGVLGEQRPRSAHKQQGNDEPKINPEQPKRGRPLSSKTTSTRTSSRNSSADSSYTSYSSDCSTSRSRSTSRDKKTFPQSDHQLKNTNNPSVLGWLKKKNKLIRAQKKEKRKEKRAKRKKEEEEIRKKEERQEMSKTKVDAWMKKKRHETRLLKMRARRGEGPTFDNKDNVEEEETVDLQEGKADDNKEKCNCGHVDAAKSEGQDVSSKTPTYKPPSARKSAKSPARKQQPAPSKREPSPDQRRVSYDEWLKAKQEQKANAASSALDTPQGLEAKKRPASAQPKSQKVTPPAPRPSSAHPVSSAKRPATSKSKPQRPLSISYPAPSKKRSQSPPKPEIKATDAYNKVKYQQKSWDKFSDRMWGDLNEEEGEAPERPEPQGSDKPDSDPGEMHGGQEVDSENQVVGAAEEVEETGKEAEALGGGETVTNVQGAEEPEAAEAVEHDEEKVEAKPAEETEADAAPAETVESSVSESEEVREASAEMQEAEVTDAYKEPEEPEGTDDKHTDSDNEQSVPTNTPKEEKHVHFAEVAEEVQLDVEDNEADEEEVGPESVEEGEEKEEKEAVEGKEEKGQEEEPNEKIEDQAGEDGGEEEAPQEKNEDQVAEDGGEEEAPKEKNEDQVTEDGGEEEAPKEKNEDQVAEDGGQEEAPKEKTEDQAGEEGEDRASERKSDEEDDEGIEGEKVEGEEDEGQWEEQNVRRM